MIQVPVNMSNYDLDGQKDSYYILGMLISFCIETCVYLWILVEFGETVAVMYIELYQQNMK